VDNLGSLPLHLKHGILLVQGEEIDEDKFTYQIDNCREAT